jgi:hypothetical protein
MLHDVDERPGIGRGAEIGLRGRRVAERGEEVFAGRVDLRDESLNA